MPQKRLFVSDSFAVLEDAFATAVQAIKGEDPLSPLTVLVPTHALTLRLRRLIARRGKGHFNLRFFTLIDFAREVAGLPLAEEECFPIPPLAGELIVKRLLAKAQAGEYFAPLRDLPGFPRALLATIDDLKQAGVGSSDLRAFAERARLTGLYRQKVSALFGLYERYNRFLHNSRLFDDHGLFARATETLKAKPWAGPLLVYGFYDFTLRQRQLIEAAVSRTDTLIFFPWRQASAYEFATPTLTWFAGLGFQVVSLDRGQQQETDLTRVQHHLFAEARPEPSRRARSGPSRRDGTVKIISAPGEAREVREIARVVLELVQEQGLKFYEIGIFLRNPEVYSQLLTETFSRLGIPVFLYGGLPLSHTHAGKAFLLLCRVLIEDFSRERVIEFLTFADLPFPTLLGEQASHALPSHWEQMSTEAGIVKGKEEWLERLPRLRAAWQRRETEIRDRDRDRDREGMVGRSLSDNSVSSVLDAFTTFMQGFLSDCEQVLPVATWKERVQTCLTLFEKYVGQSAHTDRVKEAIGRLQSLDVVGEAVTVKEWTKAVERVLSAATVRMGAFKKEGVFVGDVLSAREVPFRAVIIPGLVEGGFPRSLRQDPLFVDEERQHFSETLLLEIPQKRRLFDEERLLFTLAVQGATESLILTYPRLDPATARERLASFYLLRVIEAVTSRPAVFQDLEEWCTHVPLSPFFAGSSCGAIDPLEFHLAQATEAKAQENTAPLSYLSTLSPSFVSALTAQVKRWRETSLTEFDGVLQDERAKVLLQEKFLFSPPVLSPSALETYARCPFRYFLSYLLALTPLERPESVVTLSPRDRGALVHSILRDFFAQLKSLGFLPLSSQDPSVLERLLLEAADRHFTRFAREGLTGFPLLWELEQERLREDLLLLLRREREMGGDFLPAGFEVHFGMGKRQGQDEFSTPEQVLFPLGDEEAVALRGRIDRIDVSADKTRARIVDYKTGKLVRGTFARGEALQLPLYLFAAKHLWSRFDWVGAEYTYVNPKGKGHAQVFSPESWAGQLVTLTEIVRTLVHSMQEGLFFAAPPSCGECPFSLICGKNAKAVYERKKEDPRAQPFLRLKEIS